MLFEVMNAWYGEFLMNPKWTIRSFGYYTIAAALEEAFEYALIDGELGMLLLLLLWAFKLR